MNTQEEGRIPVIFEATPKSDKGSYKKGLVEQVYIWVMLDGRVSIFRYSAVNPNPGYCVYDTIDELYKDFDVDHEDAKEMITKRVDVIKNRIVTA